MNSELSSALAELIKNETSDDAVKYKNLILKRIAEETDVKPTRIPAPLNITELGGYYNLLEEMSVKLPDPSEFGSQAEYERFRSEMMSLRLWLEKQKCQLQLSIIQSALGLPK